MHSCQPGLPELHLQAVECSSFRHVATGAYNTKNAIKPNPVRQNNMISMYLVTRLCQNADATFTTDDNCVMPVMTAQQAICQVTNCSREQQLQFCNKCCCAVDSKQLQTAVQMRAACLIGRVSILPCSLHTTLCSACVSGIARAAVLH